jgi:hypothetical protein
MFQNRNQVQNTKLASFGVKPTKTRQFNRYIQVHKSAVSFLMCAPSTIIRTYFIFVASSETYVTHVQPVVVSGDNGFRWELLQLILLSLPGEFL